MSFDPSQMPSSDSQSSSSYTHHDDSNDTPNNNTNSGDIVLSSQSVRSDDYGGKSSEWKSTPSFDGTKDPNNSPSPPPFIDPNTLPMRPMSEMPPFPLLTAGDLDAFVALFVNNLATLLSVVAAVTPFMGEDIIYQKMVPAVGYSVAIGNFYYAFMAYRMGRRTGEWPCALPYGINTPGAFLFAFAVIGTAYGSPSYADKPIEEKQLYSWRVGMAANFIAGIFLLAGSFVGEIIAKAVPIVALLTSLSGIGVMFLAFNSFLQPMDYPEVSAFPIFIIFVAMFGGVTFRIKGYKIPPALLGAIIGSAIGWAFNDTNAAAVRAKGHYVTAEAPVFTFSDIGKALGDIGNSLNTIIPTALTVAIGTIQCVKTAHLVDDHYSIRWSMIGDGIGTLVGAFTGSFLGTTVFIGHPLFKKLGAKITYSILHGVLFFVICTFGLIAPLGEIIVTAAIQPIIVAIGLDIATETLSLTPKRHFPAFIFGLLPAIANWAQTTLIADVSGAFSSAYSALPPTNSTIPIPLDYNTQVSQYLSMDTSVGIPALSNGSILLSIFYTAIMMATIDRNFIQFAIWNFISFLFSLFGFIHTNVGWPNQLTNAGKKFTVCYAILSVVGMGFWFVQQKLRWIEGVKKEGEGEGNAHSNTQENQNNSHQVHGNGNGNVTNQGMTTSPSSFTSFPDNHSVTVTGL